MYNNKLIKNDNIIIKKKYCYYCKKLMKLNTVWYCANDKLFCCRKGQYLELLNNK